MLPTQSTRTESDKLIKELKLVFGEKEYIVSVLRTLEAAKWREEYFAKTKDVADSMPKKFEQENDPRELAKALRRGVMGALLQFPEKIPELVLSYAKSLTEDQKKDILANAYDQEFRRAYKQIWEVAFAPFLESCQMLMEMQNSRPSPSLSAAELN
jgi:hypothetical protein